MNNNIFLNIVNKNYFEFEYVIGRGGFGKVWQVTMKKNNKKYALKEMSKVRIIDRRSEKSIRGERDFLSILRHPFIVNMNCAFQDYENLYLVMDLLTGGDLRYHLCKIRRFSEDETKFFIACLLLGLEYIHKNNIIHRDIKPENLVSDENGYIRITDFGVAKIRKEDNSSETSGTPGYMAPEVLMAQNHSFPVDFFAIGIMGYEFMIGQRPYLGKTRKEIKHLVLKKQAKIDEDDIPDGWSEESVDFINNCLKRKESRRLGYINGVSDLKNHKWFKKFDWESLYNKTMQAPFVPKKAGNYDKKYCEGVEKVSETTLDRYQSYLRKKNFKHIFDGYTYINNELIQNTETLSNITTATKSYKHHIKTNSSLNTDKINKLAHNNLHINIENKEIKIEDNNKEKKIDLSSNKENTNKTNILQDNNNFISFSNREEKNKMDLPSNSILISNKEEHKKEMVNNNKDNSNLSLQNYLNYSKQKRMKFRGGNKDIIYKKEEERNVKENANEKLSNLSGLEPSSILYNSNFKKIGTKNEEKKARSSSVCYSSNNNHDKSTEKKKLNKTNLLNEGGKTIDVNKINNLYNFINMNNKGSLSGRHIDKHTKINFIEQLSFRTRLDSPKNAYRPNLKLKRDFNGDNNNKMMHFYLPNLMKGGTLSPSFMNGLKLKGKINLSNLNSHLKLKKNKNDKQNIGINYKKLMNENNTKRPTSFKRSSSTSMFNQFINNNLNRGFSSKRNRNPSENRSHFGNNGSQFYYNNNKKSKKLHHNSSAGFY